VNTTPEYVPYLLAAQASATQQIGVNIYGVARELYVTNLSLLALIGMITRALHDKGVVTDGEWLDYLNAAYSPGPWPVDMLNQIPPTPQED
jgi:hypothetical protein